MEDSSTVLKSNTYIFLKKYIFSNVLVILRNQGFAKPECLSQVFN